MIPMRCLRPWLLPAAIGLMAPCGCSLLFDLDALSEGTSGAGAGDASSTISAGGAGGAGSGGGTAGAGAMGFTDDELDGEFGAGTFDSTAWTGDRVALAPGATQGEFRSRVFDAASPATWQAISWSPLAPYSKPLPDNGEDEIFYDEGEVDMEDNVLLLHLDGEGPLPPGLPIPDTSGRANHFISEGVFGAAATFTAGRFGAAIEDGLDTWLFTVVGPTSDFQFDEGDFTWALWVRTTQDCTGNKVHLGVEDGSPGAHLWLGCAPPSYENCPAGAAGGRAAGYLTSAQGTDLDGDGFCSAKVITDGAWHHVALTKQGHASAVVRLYVDGLEEDVRMMSFVGPFVFAEAPQLAVGAFSGGSYKAAGTFDEVAIWLRALDPDEITALYHRGALRLGLQVRPCPDATCATGGAFTGPGLQAGTFFLDPPYADEPGTAVPITGVPASRFFQYLVRFETDVPGLSPGLEAVTLTAATTSP